MHQEISYFLRCLEQWHQCNVSKQWAFDDWKDFAKVECRQWGHQRVLIDAVRRTETKPTHNHMYWYRLVRIDFFSEDMYLYDPRYTTYTQQTSTSNLNKITKPRTHKPTTITCYTPNHKTENIPHTTTNMIIIKTPNKHRSVTHPHTIAKTPMKHMTPTLSTIAKTS